MGVFSSGFKNGSLWNSDFISFRVLPAWEMRTKPVPTVWVKDLIIQKTKQEAPSVKKIKQTFKFNVSLEYNVHLENVSLSEGCEIWEIIGREFSSEKTPKNIITAFSYLCLCSNTDPQKFMGITSNLLCLREAAEEEGDMIIIPWMWKKPEIKHFLWRGW